MRAHIAAAVAATLVVACSAQGQCFEKYQCIFHHNLGNQEYSWDMHQLCQQPGNEYTAIDAANHTYSFNICGNVSTLCTPSYSMYTSSGVAIQSWGDAPAACTPQTMTCTNYDTGAPACCTANCEVLGTEFFVFELIDPNNPLTGGVRFRHTGMPPTADGAQCPPIPGTFLPTERQLSLEVFCDQGAKNVGLSILGAQEVSPCQYLVQAKSKAACGVKGDPFDGYRDDPGHSFGFVVLGATLCVVVQLVYMFGNARGWWNPIKRHLPSWLGGTKGVASTGSGYSGSSSYKNIASTTPITASAYGST